jgi:hypothetical protein
MRLACDIAVGSHVLTEKKHLDLISLHHFISLQLVFNLLVPGLALFLLCAHTAAHLAGLLYVHARSLVMKLSRR